MEKIEINLTEDDLSFLSLWAEAVDMPIEKLIERIVRDTLKKGAERMLAAIMETNKHRGGYQPDKGHLDSTNQPKGGSGLMGKIRGGKNSGKGGRKWLK